MIKLNIANSDISGHKLNSQLKKYAIVYVGDLMNLTDNILYL